MTASKKNVPLALISLAVLASCAILVTALKGDSMLRIALAAGGFVGFGGLLVALLVAGRRTPSIK